MAILTIQKATPREEEDVEMVYSDADSDAEEQMVMSDGENEDMDDNAQAANVAAGLVTPGKLITEDPIWMRGHGTYSVGNKTFSSTAGVVTKTNKLLSVVPLRGRYQPQIGDHVVGRIVDVGVKRWRVDIGAKQLAVLQLGSVNLPGGILRRKQESDELQMRGFLKEGDLINTEVQSLYQDGSAALHTRSLRYGKLRNGVLITVPSALIVRAKSHVHQLPGGVDTVVGVNGWIWLCMAWANSHLTRENTTSITRLEEEASLTETYSDKNEDIPRSVRENIARYANCFKALAANEVGITEDRVIAAYEASLVYPSAGDLIDKEAKEIIAAKAIAA
ncbi:hypothetical protein B0I73DRAFT_136452 [Yarrowia lipolytica]|uniref:Uncharacterized protein n=1 Tax=Yarrowia lipolytica TaxID=4952 RepID=A0A371C061_YARLL|nr:hypothetical protein B0I71DRAFT_136154 [Yarrowia lipolytica]RDW36848.1 hypothetical protein B0I73DRAFT_136452 [Yarrowia lipolytica]RDW46522.1 hypothetical protein B0I74DRAFT_136955 [Yarrowia lipolytica]RDW52974.1 hypothetical protein B0I75DRAFT_137272 [Yarrowia lipolytica]